MENTTPVPVTDVAPIEPTPTPSEPTPASGGPYIVTASRVESPAERKEILRIPRRFPGFLWILVPPTVMYLITAPIELLTSYAQPVAQIESIAVMVVAAIAALIWWIVYRRRTKAAFEKQPIFVGYRRIEVHEQGVVCRGETERTVIPYDEVTAYWELGDKLVLFGKDNYIFWRIAELTAEEADRIRAAVCAHLPQGTCHQKRLGRARINVSLPLPALPREKEAEETVGGKLFPEGTPGRRFGRLLAMLGAPLLLMSGLIGTLLGGLFRWSVPLLQSGFVWFVAFALLCLLLLWVCLWLDGAGERKRARTVTVWRTRNGVRVSDGRDEREFVSVQVKLRKAGKKTLLHLPTGTVVLDGDLPAAPVNAPQTAPTPPEHPVNPENNDNAE